jgi:hypothetical protein
MQGEVQDTIESAVAKRRAELEAMSLPEVGQAFETTYGIQPNLSAGKSDLIERVLAKYQAQLRRMA